MNKFIFKSASGLLKNSSITLSSVMTKLLIIQGKLRHARQDNTDIKLMLNKLLVDKHLQMQVDEYFTEDSKQEDI